MNCSLCDIDVPQERIDEGYTICVKCSTEEKVSCHTIYPHKTGGYIQVVSKEQSKNLNRLDRRGTSMKTARHYKEFKVDTIDEPKPIKRYRCNKTYTSFDTALKMVMDYYDEWGYEPTLKYLRGLNSSGEIPLMTRVRIQNMVTDMYLTPTPRALIRKFNRRI
jgi:phage terminase large subunit GpA-like protein|tara:strand:+ start:831 stop:1319 length:489 start_codon:yes stop_codon:yes gene_type:complete